MDSQIAALSSVGVLIEAVGRDSQVALKRLYELEARRLYGIALRIVRRPEIAADVLQEAFVQIWQNAATFSAERGTGAAWLTGIVRFRALDAVRKLGRVILTDDPGLGDAAIEPDVIEKIDAAAEAGALKRCLKLLEEEQRRCIVWPLSTACRTRRSPSVSGRRSVASRAGSGGDCSRCGGVSNDDPRKPRRSPYPGRRIRARRSRRNRREAGRGCARDQYRAAPGGHLLGGTAPSALGARFPRRAAARHLGSDRSEDNQTHTKAGCVAPLGQRRAVALVDRRVCCRRCREPRPLDRDDAGIRSELSRGPPPAAAGPGWLGRNCRPLRFGGACG